ncbi:MAG: hypothetical protein F4X84_00950 [Synechococcus sp. SB0662_bin_45]|nr:hypothetical protein [Cyanobacteria bacterium MAG IRC3_bin_20]MDE0647512.1 hypothetical protein [Cyanobacteria bacterium MAG IRC4_bin_6]MXW13153.1 hypothetical protein [Synechococcus sp. SB0668_bin_13]MYE20971.1 hypothetical protein [Synechococcus sp. SB0662_bin_45]
MGAAQGSTRPRAGTPPLPQEGGTQGEEHRHWRRRLTRLWRLLVFSGGAVGLAWVLLEKGWWLETPNQVVFHGASQQEHGELLAASALQLPTPLLAVDPGSVQQDLQRLVSPTLQAQVRRTLAPPQLMVSLQNGAAQAWARRSLADRVEHGLLDHRFNWAGFDAQQQLDHVPTVRNHILVLADSWAPELPETLAQLFSGLERLETPVHTIRITADGQLVLGTSGIPGEVRLGQPDRLSRKLAIMDHLYAQLEKRAPPFPYAYVDLHNPDQPQLGLSRDQDR